MERGNRMDTLHGQTTPAHSNTTPAKARPSLDGATLSPTTLALIACGTLGGILFATVYLIEGATRPGYVAWQQAISALSLGAGGWMQQVNFVLFGALTLCSVIGWRQALLPGPASLGYPVLKAASGIGLIVDGFFSQDPAPGYPLGAVIGAPTTHGTIHVIFAFVSITAIAIGDFVLAWRFSTEPRWRIWALFAALTGVLTIVFIALFGATGAHGGIAGVYERVATGVNSVFGIAVFVRLLLDRRS
jgi:hypothetical protein